MKVFQFILGDKVWISYFKKCMLISLVLHVLAAIYSVGFHHFDEHFQILELLNLKLDGNTIKSLTWEFDVGMRPWLQSWILYVMTKGMLLVGIESPFIHTLFFRLLSSLIGWFSLVLVGFLSYRWVCVYKLKEKWARYIIWPLILCWFYPYIHARVSSDNWGAVFFTIAFCLVLLFYPQNAKLEDNELRPFKGERYSIPAWVVFIAGIVFGFSFQFRYQMGICIFFFYLWCLIYGRMKISSGLIMTFALILSLCIGLLVDGWGYGKFTFSAWNYFFYDVIEGIPGKTIANPWYDYFRLALLRGIPPISLVLMLGTIVFWWKFKSHPLTWITLPFFLVHNVFLHKELRYIFILVLLSPIMTTLAIQFFGIHKFQNKFWKAGFYLILFCNTILLFVSIMKPANVAPAFYSHINKKNIKTVYYKGENPFTILGLKLNYYNPQHPEINKMESYPQKNFKGWYVTTRGRDFFHMEKDVLHCKLDYITYPKWTFAFNVFHWVEKSRIWALFKCE